MLCLLLSGCNLLQVRGESHRHYAFTVLTGQVTVPADWHGGVSIAAIATGGRLPREVHRIWLHESGGYELLVPPGTYTVEASADAGDGTARAPPLHATSTPIVVQDSGVITHVDLSLHPATHDTAPKTAPATVRHSTQAGAIAAIDATVLSATTGRRGYWAPVDTFQRIGGNVYFLAPYDPAREPVLFVHGALGAGEDWRHLAPALGDEYQPWIFQYPSGASLEAMSHLLYWKLVNLRARYGFTRLHLVAHSMGGLVVRRFLLDHGAQFPEIRAFVSLSTPWGGDARAALGVAHSPAVVASWRDMQPQGVFLADLFSRRLPAHVRHTLVFSYRGASLADRTGSDGAVTLASQLRSDAEAGAWQSIGLDEDHTSILASPTTRATILRALEDAGRDPTETSRNARLQVQLQYPDADPTGSSPWLLVSPASGREAATQVLPLQRNAAGSHVAVAPGRYALQPLIPGYRAIPRDIAVSEGDSEDIAFELKPQGLLVGRVYQRGPLALPSGARAPEGAAFRSARIELEGPGIHRMLTMEADSDPQALLSAWSRGVDAAARGWFGFADLPAGTYRITARVVGHAARHVELQVVPGQAVPVLSLGIRPPFPHQDARH